MDSIGLQRLHGLNPLSRASFVVWKNVTFLGSGFLAEHVGLQKMPVVMTPVKKTPSNVASRSLKAWIISWFEGSILRSEWWGESAHDRQN